MGSPAFPIVDQVFKGISLSGFEVVSVPLTLTLILTYCSAKYLESLGLSTPSHDPQGD